ncbi:glycoside hydrolase family 88/105 protein [Flavobacterium nackdongense]|nr:glycoside hydrolase family 88 protein [Flavobacterium nackdongense]
MKLNRCTPFLMLCLAISILSSCGSSSKVDNRSNSNKMPNDAILENKEAVLSIIKKVNNHWQITHPVPDRAFWNPAAYHTGNIEAYKVTGNMDYLVYSKAWAEKNQYKGAKSKNKSDWKYTYGETDDYVLFGDWQIAFQTYIDIYTLEGKKDPEKIKRALEVMEYQMGTNAVDYWWWVDGLYMVMPVMTKLYKVTGNELYLKKLHEYLSYSNSILYDDASQLYFRDAKYVYPKHQSANGRKDFWARGNGWIFAGLAKVIQDLPKDALHRDEYINRFKALANSLMKSQQPEGYWTRSILDVDHAPGPETSGTAFFTYGYLWGINNGILDKKTYLPVVGKSWKYLTKVALQDDGRVGYVQPIGEKAIPGQIVNANSTADFGVGAFLLAASEMYRYLDLKKM